MSKVPSALLTVLLCFSKIAVAQEATFLKLEDALEAALKSNSNITQARLEEARATAAFKQTRAIFLPQINVSYTAISTNNPLNVFGTKLQQQNVTQPDFNPEILNHPSAIQNYTAKAEGHQPLLNLDLLYRRQAAYLQTEIYSLQTRRTQSHVSFEVQKAYAQLQLAYEVKRTLEEALLTIKSIHTATTNRYTKGLLQQSDVLQAQVQVSTTESLLAEAVSNLYNTSDYLSLCMGKTPGILYRVDTAYIPTPVNSTDIHLPENRADFKAIQLSIDAQEYMINATRMAHMPRMNAFAEYMFNDDDALRFGSDSYLAGIQLSWNVFNGMATRNKVVEQRIVRNKAAEQLHQQKEQSKLELNKTKRQLQDAQFLLQQQQTAVVQATEALRIVQNRYLQGLVSTNDVLQSQTLLSQQKLYYAQAVFQLTTTQLYLQFLTDASNE
jgi:outer membrane protein TolC